MKITKKMLKDSMDFVMLADSYSKPMFNELMQVNVDNGIVQRFTNNEYAVNWEKVEKLDIDFCCGCPMMYITLKPEYAEIAKVYDDKWYISH